MTKRRDSPSCTLAVLQTGEKKVAQLQHVCKELIGCMSFVSPERTEVLAGLEKKGVVLS